MEETHSISAIEYFNRRMARMLGDTVKVCIILDRYWLICPSHKESKFFLEQLNQLIPGSVCTQTDIPVNQKARFDLTPFRLSLDKFKCFCAHIQIDLAAAKLMDAANQMSRLIETHFNHYICAPWAYNPALTNDEMRISVRKNIRILFEA